MKKTKVGRCQGETYGTIPLPPMPGRGIAFTERESHLLSVWEGGEDVCVRAAGDMRMGEDEWGEKVDKNKHSN